MFVSVRHDGPKEGVLVAWGFTAEASGASDRQHCAVHRVRNLLAKLPERERERIRQTYWRGLDEAINERAGKQRPHALEWERMFATMDAATGE